MKKTILIVDDSPTFRRILASMLSINYQVVGTGSSGFEGLELFKKLKPDLVLMDITMPNCSGKEALEMILKADPKASVIMVSGLADNSVITECLSLGAKGFIPKNTVSVSETNSRLVQLIEEIINVSVVREAT